jgi:hypothetical protein
VRMNPHMEPRADGSLVVSQGRLRM